MPAHNHFRHQLYVSDVPPDAYELVEPPRPPEAGSEDFAAAVQRAAAAWRNTRVDAVYLIHGTLAGTDALGWIGELERAMPGLASGLRRQHKRMVDAVAGEHGNYAAEFQALLQEMLRQAVGRQVPVHRFHWSSQNNHAARAEAAVLLLDALFSEEFPPSSRVHVWGHSHGGNVMALVTNLLAGGRLTRDAFWEATRPLAESASSSDVRASWQRVQDVLSKHGNPLEGVHLDLVTFGTPIRYGWDTLGYDRLLHIVNHRPQPGQPEYQAKQIGSVDDIRAAIGGRYGDYFQQTFVAGTNLPPPLTNWNAWRADRQLGRLLQRNQGSLDLLRRLKAGRRVADEGVTLLVDYASADPERANAISGHAVYTQVAWLPFHIEQIATHFYETPSQDVERAG